MQVFIPRELSFIIVGEQLLQYVCTVAYQSKVGQPAYATAN